MFTFIIAGSRITPATSTSSSTAASASASLNGTTRVSEVSSAG